MSTRPVWRLLETPPLPAADNMALDEVLVGLKGQGKSPDTIRFLQFSPRTVLVGYHQAIAEEIRTGYCREQGIDINRRITGGGALFFDENQLGWEIIADKAFFNVELPTPKLFRTLCAPVVDALAMLGIQSEFRPRNDIEVNGRKISGTGGTESGEAFLFQGTLLNDFDVDTMLRALRIPVEKLKAKEIDSIKERVTCLAWELDELPTLDRVKEVIATAFADNLGIELVPGPLTAEEEDLFAQRIGHFRSQEWIDRVRPRVNKRETVQSSYKTKAGVVRFTLAVDMVANRLRDVYITGDFLTFPARALYDLEAALRGQPMKPEVLTGIVHDFFDSGRMTIPDMDAESFCLPLLQALSKVDIARMGLSLPEANTVSVTNGTFAEVLDAQPDILLLPYCAKLKDCELRHTKGCKTCGEPACTIGPAVEMARKRSMRPISIVNFEDLWTELGKMKQRGNRAFVGCCCQPFFAKHLDDFIKAGMPGILLDIDDTTCYELDQAKDAYAGTFESQTSLNLQLLERVLDMAAPQKETT